MQQDHQRKHGAAWRRAACALAGAVALAAVTGAQALTVAAGSGAVNLLGPIGTSLTPLGAFTVTSSNATGTTIAGVNVFAASAMLEV